MSGSCHEHGGHEHREHTHHDGDGCGCGHHHGESHGAWCRLGVCIVVFIVGLAATSAFPLHWLVQPVWMAGAIAPLVWSLIKEAGEELGERSIGENTLLLVAVVAAFAIGEWVEGAMVLLLFVLGENMEHKAMDYSRRTISSLAAMTPDTALRVEAGGEVTEISAAQVAVGDTLRIPPHSRVPVDCYVLVGESEVNTAALTGESLPVYCAVGNELLSGSVNGSGELTVKATRMNAESAAARIMHLVEEATAQKGRSERFITRFARIYTPAVMMGAILVAVLPPLCGGAWSVWIYRALAFLVASCPCALVISIPLSFYAGIAAAARQGILLKGGSFVEALARVQAVGFDKTGTLTTDHLQLERITLANGAKRDTALHIAAALETGSAHPIAKALCAVAGKDLPAVTQKQELAGLGVRGVIAGQDCACGGARLMERLGGSVAAFAPSPAYVWCDGEVIAALTFSAAMQEGAASSVEALRELGVSHMAMLTGDRDTVAREVAATVGIDDVRGDLLPEDKLAAVRQWRAAGLTTVFVGDGINDAPVLAAADVGVAMGLGSPAAIETADAVLVSGGLTHLPRAVRICRHTVRTVRTNIAFALGVKVIALLLAVLGIAPMWLAVFADTGVTVLCVLNALRLLTK